LSRICFLLVLLELLSYGMPERHGLWRLPRGNMTDQSETISVQL
jgi:hypothetical protein